MDRGLIHDGGFASNADHRGPGHFPKPPPHQLPKISHDVLTAIAAMPTLYYYN
jgi:hypothetical protein